MELGPVERADHPRRLVASSIIAAATSNGRPRTGRRRMKITAWGGRLAGEGAGDIAPVEPGLRCRANRIGIDPRPWPAASPSLAAPTRSIRRAGEQDLQALVASARRRDQHPELRVSIVETRGHGQWRRTRRCRAAEVAGPLAPNRLKPLADFGQPTPVPSIRSLSRRPCAGLAVEPLL